MPEPLAPLPARSGRTTPRSAQLCRQPQSEALFKDLLRPELRRPRRARSAGPSSRGMAVAASRREQAAYGEQASRGQPLSAAEKADDTDGDWRCGSYRYCNSKFYDTLRSWHGLRDVSETTRKDWRVSAADNLGMKGGEGAYGHDQSNNDADGWKRSSTIWVDSTFRGGLRDYVGHDVSLDEEGHPRAHSKDGKFAAGTNLGNIYRSTKQANVLSTARADECFLGSLRSAPIKSAADYQRQRRRNLGLPAQEKGASPKSGSRPSSARSATPTR